MEAAEMWRQRHRFQMKKQEKTPEKELNEMEASKLKDTEYQPMVIRMLKELCENFNSMKKGTETIKKNLSKIKGILTEMKNNL